MTQTVQTKLSDEKIVELAQKIDKFIVETGMEYETSGIEIAAIALGRLMVFTQQVGSFKTFQEMMETIVMMKDMEPPKEEE